jgi:hypothetical protein
MRKAGAKGAPKKSDFANAAKTSFKEGGSILLTKSQRALENTSSKNISPTGRVFKPVESDFNTKVMGGGSVNKFGKGLGGRASVTKKLSKDSEIEGYLEGFAAKPKGGPSIAELTGGGVKLTKRFAKGGESRVNEAGNYTKPGLRKAQFLSELKQVVKAVIRANGAPAKHKCWLSSTRNQAGVIKIERSPKKPKELE